MSPAPELALIVAGVALLAATTALAGAWRWRVRALAERVRALEAIVARMESRLGAGDRPAHRPAGPRAVRIRRPDPAPEGVPPGPTLIEVPDLTATPAEAPGAMSELAGRFGAIWERADRGEPPDVIAQATGQPIGQVELILGLRRRLAAAQGRS